MINIDALILSARLKAAGDSWKLGRAHVRELLDPLCDEIERLQVEVREEHALYKIRTQERDEARTLVQQHEDINSALRTETGRLQRLLTIANRDVADMERLGIAHDALVTENRLFTETIDALRADNERLQLDAEDAGHHAMSWQQLNTLNIIERDEARADVERLERERGEYRNSFHDKIIECDALWEVAEAAHKIAYVLLVGRSYDQAILDIRDALAALPPRTTEEAP